MLSLSRFCLILTVLLPICLCFTSPSSCTGSQYYNYLSHICMACPTGTVPSQNDNTYCNCSTGAGWYRKDGGIGFNHSSSCGQASANMAGANSVYGVYAIDGTVQTTVAEVVCTGGFPNVDKTACIPCGPDMTYDTNLKLCKCSRLNFYPVNGYCVDGTTLTNPFAVNTENNLLFGMGSLGCTVSSMGRSACQILLNKCAQAGYNGNQFCKEIDKKVNANAIKNYVSSNGGSDVSLGIYASSVLGANTTTVKNKLNFIVFQYDKYGKLLDIKPFGPQIILCIATQQDAIKFQSFGLNLVKTCQTPDLKSSTLFYDIFVQNSQSSLIQIFTKYPSSSLYKRYHPLSSLPTMSLTFTSLPPLSIPSITLSSTDPPSFSTTSLSSSVSLTLLAPFIIFNVAILVIFLINFAKYTKYNPNDNNDPYFCFKIILIFLLMGLKHWGVGLWIFIFGTSMYCFCFYKFQQTVYLMLPDLVTQWVGYYQQFMIVFYIQFGFVLVSVGLLIYQLGNNVQYFMIDWEKEKNVGNFDIHMGKNKRQISVWRKVLVVNQLYQLTIREITNIPIIVIFGIFFLDGLKWINLSYQIPNVNDVNTDPSTTSTKNVVLAYFLITFIFFIIAAIMYIARYLIKTWDPMPYEDFVDLCCISNISLIMFDHDLHGYYIHGMNPLGRAEGTLGYIQSIFEKQAKAFGKSRAFRNDDPSQTQTFQVCFPTEIRQAFQMKYKNRYLQKLVGRAYDTSIFSKPIPQMLDENDYKQIESIQNDMLQSFKYYLQGVKTSQFNVKQRTFLQKLVSCPVDKQYMGRLPIFFKDFWHQFTKVTLCGYQFLLLINLINFINIFYIATGSVTIAALITMVICRLGIKNIGEIVIKRNISKNTLIDDKFFN